MFRRFLEGQKEAYFSLRSPQPIIRKSENARKGYHQRGLSLGMRKKSKILALSWLWMEVHKVIEKLRMEVVRFPL